MSGWTPASEGRTPRTTPSPSPRHRGAAPERRILPPPRRRPCPAWPVGCSIITPSNAGPGRAWSVPWMATLPHRHIGMQAHDGAMSPMEGVRPIQKGQENHIGGVMFEVIVISFAFIAGLAARQIGLPPLVGFLGSGFALSATGGALGLPAYSGEVLEHMAHIGVLMLLFTVGLKLKLGQLIKPHVIGGGLAH